MTNNNDLYIKKLLDIIDNSSNKETLLFFVGSGISTTYPSLLPSAFNIVTKTIKALLPKPLITNCNHELDIDTSIISNILPEIYYEIITETLNDKILGVWKLLDFWKSSNILAKYKLGPNIYHLIIVYLSWKNKKPIITTNFDNLFEEAAKRLSLFPIVSNAGDKKYQFSQDLNSVAIWKVHGSLQASSFDSISSTISKITKADWLKLNSIKQAFGDSPVCFVGYSGRDIDLFPFISSWNSNEIFWIDPYFPDWHVIHDFPGKFNAIKENLDFIINHVTTKNSDKQVEVVKQYLKIKTSSKEIEKIKSVFDKIATSHIQLTVDKSDENVEEIKDLIQAKTLFKMGAIERANKFADRFIQNLPLLNLNDFKINSNYLISTFLLKAKISHHLSKYIDSFNYANIAKRIAKSNKNYEYEVEAIVACDEALRMQHLPRLFFRDNYNIFNFFSWYVLLQFIIHSIIITFNSNGKIFHPEENKLKTTFIFIDHLVRLGSILQHNLLYILPKKMVAYIFGWFWHFLEKTSHEVGFAEGIAYSRRYGNRIGIKSNNSLLLDDLPLSIMMSEKTGQAISYRDKAIRIYDRLKEEENINKKISMIDQAKNLLEKSFSLSFEIKNYSLALKGMILLKKIDPVKKFMKPQVEFIFSQIQGRGYRKVEHKIIRWLCN